MASTRRRRIRAHHEREVLAREAPRRRDAVAHGASAGHGLDALAIALAVTALVVALVLIVLVLLA
jgi:hypothetical protein